MHFIKFRKQNICRLGYTSLTTVLFNKLLWFFKIISLWPVERYLAALNALRCSNIPCFSPIVFYRFLRNLDTCREMISTLSIELWLGKKVTYHLMNPEMRFSRPRCGGSCFLRLFFFQSPLYWAVYFLLSLLQHEQWWTGHLQPVCYQTCMDLVSWIRKLYLSIDKIVLLFFISFFNRSLFLLRLNTLSIPFIEQLIFNQLSLQ